MQTWLKVVIGVLVLMFACCGGTMVLGVVGASKAQRDLAEAQKSGLLPSSASPSVPAGPAIEVDARKLWADYHSNEVSADDTYKGKRLRVTGTLHAISKDITDSIYLELESENPYMSSHATLDQSQKATAAALKKGQKVTVECIGGGMFAGSPVLRGCTVAQ